MKVKLEDVCECGSSNLRQSDAAGRSGDYPIYGASGYIGNVDFYYQERPYVAVVKDGAGVGRAMLLPAKSSVIAMNSLAIRTPQASPSSRLISSRYRSMIVSGISIPVISFFINTAFLRLTRAVILIRLQTSWCGMSA